MKDNYGWKEVPNVTIDCFNSETLNWDTYELQCLRDYNYTAATPNNNLVKTRMEFNAGLFRPDEYSKFCNNITNKTYSVFKISTETIWRNAETGKDEICKDNGFPVFTKCSLSVGVSDSGDPTNFYFIFWE